MLLCQLPGIPSRALSCLALLHGRVEAAQALIFRYQDSFEHNQTTLRQHCYTGEGETAPSRWFLSIHCLDTCSLYYTIVSTTVSGPPELLSIRCHRIYSILLARLDWLASDVGAVLTGPPSSGFSKSVCLLNFEPFSNASFNSALSIVPS